MRLYEGTVSDFGTVVIENKIADLVASAYQSYYGKRVSQSEYRAWQQSFNFLRNAFDFSGLRDNKIIIEYELPYSTRRIDVLTFGRDDRDSDSVVLMELKQWSNESVEDCPTEGNIYVDYGRYQREQAHPSLQVQGYHYDLKDFITAFREKPAIALSSCAYCHNYSREGLKPILFYPKFNKAREAFPVFAKEDVQSLGVYLKERLAQGNGFELFGRFVTSPIRPSKMLLEHTSEMIHKQQVFNLIDDQIAAYNSIMHKARKLAETDRKAVVIIKGGPGTGKSVIALEVMGELMRKGKTVFHATGSKAFTYTLRALVGNRANRLFQFTHSFATSTPHSIDVLICDERCRSRACHCFRRSRREPELAL